MEFYKDWAFWSFVAAMTGLLYNIVRNWKNARKAKLAVCSYKKGDGGTVLQINNIGQATAKNIRIEGFDNKNYSITNLCILPFGSLDTDSILLLYVWPVGRNTHKLTFTLLWDDLFKNNKKEHSIQVW